MFADPDLVLPPGQIFPALSCLGKHNIQRFKVMPFSLKLIFAFICVEPVKKMYLQLNRPPLMPHQLPLPGMYIIFPESRILIPTEAFFNNHKFCRYYGRRKDDSSSELTLSSDEDSIKQSESSKSKTLV